MLRCFNLLLLLGVAFSAPDATIPTSKNSTVNLVTTQSLFDNIQFNLINPIFDILNATVVSKGFNISYNDLSLGFFDLSMNNTNITLQNLTSDNSTRLVTLNETEQTVLINITDFTFNITWDYELLSNPPIFADIGITEILLDRMFLHMLFTPYNNNSYLNLDIHKMNTSVGQFYADFDGISDMSQVVGGLITGVGQIIGNRINSMLKFKVGKYIQPLINSILNSIPQRLYYPGSDVYLEGGYCMHPLIKDDRISSPMNLQLQSNSSVFKGPPLPVMPLYSPDGYQVQLFLSEYLLDDGLFFLQKEGVLDFNISDAADVSFLSTFLHNIEKNFTNTSAPCVIGLNSLPPLKAPNITMHKDKVDIAAGANVDFYCKKNNASEFTQVVTLVNDITFDASFKISDNLTLFLDISNLNIVVTKAENSSIGTVKIGEINDLMYIFVLFLQPVINDLFANGWPLYQTIHNLTGLDWLDFEKARLENGERYLELQITPKFNKTGLQEFIIGLFNTSNSTNTSAASAAEPQAATLTGPQVRESLEMEVPEFDFDEEEISLPSKFAPLKKVLGDCLQSETFGYLMMPFIKDSRLAKTLLALK